MHSYFFRKCEDKESASQERLEDKSSGPGFGLTRRRVRLKIRQFLYREVLHRRSLKEDRVHKVDKAFTRQGCRGFNGSLIIEEKGVCVN